MYFKNGLCYVELANRLVGYINKNGTFVVKPELFCAWPFAEGRAVVFPSNSNRNALIDTLGNSIFEPENSQFSGIFSEGVIKVSKYNLNNKTQQVINWFIDRKGKK